jgi:16S rRNA (adenine1518-N6/adenine1519-N6)-dimethyltransferase
MQTLQEIRSLLDAYGLAPKRSMGQNFLIDQNLIRGLVDASGVAAGELVLEIGPGTGTLTEELLDRGCRVVACELDNGMVRLLTDRFRDRPAGQFTLIAGDCLAGKSELNPEITESLGGSEFRLIANLPYGAASPLMVLLARNAMCLGQYVTIQREVAERVRAKVGTKDYSELSVLVQACAEVRKLSVLPPECFWPRPKVVSEMIAIEPRREGRMSDSEYNQLGVLSRKLFTQRRKQIGAVLGRDRPFPEGIDASARPEQLTVDQLQTLATQFLPKSS